MERNRWDTAIRCLEVALHPNTGDEEVIAAVNGFRRTADGTPLREICRALGGASHLAVVAAGSPSRAEVERLMRENRDLRRELEAAERGRLAATRRLRQVMRLAGKWRDDARAAHSAAASAERQSAEFQTAQAPILDRLNRENTDLRRALDLARRIAAAPPARPATPAPPPAAFDTVLAAALHGTQPATASARPPALPVRGTGAAWIA